MNYIEIFLLAFSLSLDCFAISISHSLKPSISKKSIFTLAILFGLFQGLMFVLGFYFGNYLLSLFKSFANVIAFLLLLYIGVKMVKEGFEVEDEEVEDITQVKQYFVLSIATSIDALATGVSFTAIKANFVLTSLVVGLISFIMALIGGFSGKKIGEKLGKRSEIFGGIVLIILGIKILIS
ncbi:MAG: manganese efflux pump [Candidatus Sericytochromatia bacterium]